LAQIAAITIDITLSLIFRKKERKTGRAPKLCPLRRGSDGS
jgi:hypothetical protein